MRKILLLAAALLLTIPCAVVYAGDDDPIDVVIGDEGSNGGGRPHHAPALIPIEATYYPLLSSILVDCLYDLGSVSVVIENQTTGAYSQTVVNATQGVHPFLISGDIGVYEVTFTLSDGHTYIGSFEIE